MRITRKKVLITGGASGLGLEIARRFAADANTVIACGRRAEALEQARRAIPGLVTHSSDLSTEHGREDLYAWIRNEHPDLNVLVNNAGVQEWMNVTDDNFYERARTEIATNVEAPLHLTQLILRLPEIEVIANVTSGLAFAPLTRVPVYSATKAFMRSFTQSLRQLLKPRAIRVIEIIPPALNTDLGGKGKHDFAPPVSDFVDAMFDQLGEGSDEIAFGFSSTIVRAGPKELAEAFNRMNSA